MLDLIAEAIMIAARQCAFPLPTQRLTSNPEAEFELRRNPLRKADSRR